MKTKIAGKRFLRHSLQTTFCTAIVPQSHHNLIVPARPIPFASGRLLPASLPSRMRNSAAFHPVLRMHPLERPQHPIAPEGTRTTPSRFRSFHLLVWFGFCWNFSKDYDTRFFTYFADMFHYLCHYSSPLSASASAGASSAPSSALASCCC